MGFWAALEEAYPKTRQQRCWMHKTMNVLNCLPKSGQPKAKQALHDIWQVETKDAAEKAFDLFIKPMNQGIQRRLYACTKTGKSYWPFTIFQHSIGKV